MGQTAIKTQEVIQKAIGGVLFIDEAYALVNQDSPNDFGHEAIEVLLKNMEDHRKDLIVIVAGYSELMNDLSTPNPGLESRFNKYFYFEDYTGPQLMEIFQSMCQKNGYVLSPEAAQWAEQDFLSLYEGRDENFGNARDVRNLFEKAVSRQSDRVAALEKPGKEELMALTVADLQEEGGPVPDGAPDETPPESREGGVVDQSVLGVDQVQGSAVEEGFPTGGALRTGVLFREIDKLIVELLEDIVHEKPP